MLTPILSRQRQKRLLEVMEKRRLDAVVIGANHHVYYFTAHFPFPGVGRIAEGWSAVG